MSAGNWLEEKALKHIFNLAAMAQPANLFVALSTANPGEDAAGIAEPVGAAYARKQTVPADWTWNAGASRIENANDVVFAAATGSWGTLTHYAVYDALAAGNLLFYAPLLAAKAIGNGDVPKFAAGVLTFTAD